MKKVRDIIFSFSLVFIVIVSILGILTFITSKGSVYLETDSALLGDMKQIRVNIDELPDGDCKNNLKDFYQYVNDTSYLGKTKINKFYSYMSSTYLAGSYNDIKATCKLPEEKLKEYSISNRYLSIMALETSLVDNYLYQYEIGFTDPLKKDVIEGTTTFDYTIMKKNEIELLKDFLRILEEI